MSSRKKKYKGVPDAWVSAAVAAAASDPRILAAVAGAASDPPPPVVTVPPRPVPKSPTRVPVRRHEPRVPRRLTDAEMLAKLSPWAGADPEIDLVLEELVRRINGDRTGVDIGGGWRVVDEEFHTMRADGPRNQYKSSDVTFESILGAFDKLHAKPASKPTTPWDVI